MSTVVNKTTFQYLESVNTPDYSEDDWIINPDLTGLYENGTYLVPTKYWKYADGYLQERTQAEKDEVDGYNLDALKASKFAVIDQRTGELIAEGFSCDGYVFSLSTEAQSRLMGLNQVRDNPAVTYPVRWNSKDDTQVYELYDSDMVLTFYLTAVGTYRAHVDSGTDLKDEVRDAEDTAEVNAVVDTR
jgi:hypothetical protein